MIGIGCTGALLLALMLYTLSAGGFGTAFGAFLGFSGTMGLLMVAVTALVGLSQATLIRSIRGGVTGVRRVAGAILLVIGSLASGLEGMVWFTRIFFPFLS